MVPRRDALLGNTFETRKTPSRFPAMASAITSSASPYISAVSIWVMPRSMPRCNAAMALLRSPRSRYQVPCPITDTSGPLVPNFCVRNFRLVRIWLRRPSPIQCADVSDQYRTSHRLRDVETIAVAATDRDIGTALAGTGFDAGD